MVAHTYHLSTWEGEAEGSSWAPIVLHSQTLSQTKQKRNKTEKLSHIKEKFFANTHPENTC